MGVDEADRWLGETARVRPEPYRAACERYPVLSPSQVRRRGGHEWLAGDTLTALRWAYRPEGGPKDRTHRRLGPLVEDIGDRAECDAIRRARPAWRGPLSP